jgi:ATP-dependent RNA helicase DDX54/DBP10
MGFSIQLHELLNRLPSTRQTLLFSATLPKTLVEFAKAGLQNPKLVRLDADAKISSDLQMSFLTIKANEKEAALLCLLRDIIKVPFHKEQPVDNGKGKKRKREDDPLPPHQSIIFAATKHHVEYLTTLLEAAGYSVSQIYGSLDQTNRKMQLASFRSGRTSLLVVTDLAARGIDIPLLQNVVNYDFPVGGRSFVHRVGRTARAGRKGWAYSFVTATDMPHLLDLETFLGRPLQAAPFTGVVEYSNRLVLGGFPRDTLENENEHIRNVLIEPSPTLIAQQNTALKGQKMYEKSTSKASPESYRRSKEFLSKHAGLFGALSAISMLNPVFEQISSEAQSRAALLAKINSFTPNETIFEMGTRGKTPAALVMHARRKVMQVGQARRAQKAAEAAEDGEEEQEKSAFVTDDVEMAEEEELQDAFEVPADWRDKSVYMDYVVEGAQQEKG